MKYKYNNQWKDLTVKAGDTLPIGTIVDYDGDTVPTGYEEVNSSSETEFMRIKKTFQTTVPTGKVLNNRTESNVDTYSCDYINLIGKTITMNSGGVSSQSLSVNTLTEVTNTTNEYFNQFTNNEITYSNGEYTINSDNIHTVLVNTQLFFQSSALTQCYIRKNNVTEMQSGFNNSKHPATFIINVQKNDKISIATYVESSNSLRADQNNFSQITVLG